MTAQHVAVEITGSGPPLVALHGWGGGRRVFDPVAPALAARHRLIRVDLPGCGGSRPDRCGADLDAIAAAVLAAVPRPAAWLGWSLGGLVALAAARREPAAVRALTLVGASPRFVATSAGPFEVAWPGIESATFEDFAAGVAVDTVAAHARFLAFQVAGSTGARPALRALRRAAAADGVPDRDTLANGLAILRSADLRGALRALPRPVTAILGDADPLVPPATARALRHEGVAVTTIAGAGHAPFASHPATFVECLRGQAGQNGGVGAD